jgi:putative transcriptional regulator
MAAKSFLDGQLLIAMPGIGDSRFSRSLIYMCAHSENGAMGLIVNKPAPMMFFADIVTQLNIPGLETAEQLPPELLTLPVLFGGPVEQNRGFVLHSRDYFSASASLAIRDDIALTATVEILEAIARGTGPRKMMMALGYAGWVAGQLEDEIMRNGWLHCEADDLLLFGTEQDSKYERALRKLGVDPSMLSGEAGHG